MRAPANVVTGIKYVLFVSCLVILVVFLYGLMFAKPQVFKGVIVNKLYIPKEQVGTNSILPYMRYKSKDYQVTAIRHDQWLVLVEMNDGQVLKVNCRSEHYNEKHVGDTLHFKEYAGDIMGIDYFSHNEEDEDFEKEG